MTSLDLDLDVRSTCGVRVVEVEGLGNIRCGRHASSRNIFFIVVSCME
jgi:hypothetical protein